MLRGGVKEERKLSSEEERNLDQKIKDTDK